MEDSQKDQILLTVRANMFSGRDVVITEFGIPVSQTPEAVGGHLDICANGLLFRAHQVNFLTGEFWFPREAIFSIERRSTGPIPNGLIVEMKNHERIRFVVSKRKDVINIIGSAYRVYA